MTSYGFMEGYVWDYFLAGNSDFLDFPLVVRQLHVDRYYNSHEALTMAKTEKKVVAEC